MNGSKKNALHIASWYVRYTKKKLLTEKPMFPCIKNIFIGADNLKLLKAYQFLQLRMWTDKRITIGFEAAVFTVY